MVNLIIHSPIVIRHPSLAIRQSPLPTRQSSLAIRHSSPVTRHSELRSRAYALLGRLFLEGLTPDLYARAEAVPDLASALPAPGDPDALAADHYRLFHLNVFPYAGVFLDPSGRLGGHAANAAARRFAGAGYALSSADPPDHAGHLLGFLAFLCGAEADALDDERPGEAERMRRHQRETLDADVLPWLPAFTFAVRREAHPFYTALADLTLELALDHRATLDPAPEVPPPDRLPPPPPLLDDPTTGLKDVAHYLATPPWCGLFLSRDTIGRLGRAGRLPRGFGSRSQMLTTLLRAAVDYDQVSALLDHLATLLRSEEDAYRALPAPPLAAPWLDRLAATRRLLDRLRSAAEPSHPG